jgi:hypothetical protein
MLLLIWMEMIPLIWIVIQNTLWTDWLKAKIPLIDWLKAMLRNVTIQKMTSIDWLKVMQRNVNLQKMPSTACQHSILSHAIPEIYCYISHRHYCVLLLSNCSCHSCCKYYDYAPPLYCHDNLHDNRGDDDNGYDDKHQLLLQQQQQNKGEDMHKYKGDNRAHIQVNRHTAQQVLIQQLQR